MREEKQRSAACRALPHPRGEAIPHAPDEDERRPWWGRGGRGVQWWRELPAQEQQGPALGRLHHRRGQGLLQALLHSGQTPRATADSSPTVRTPRRKGPVRSAHTHERWERVAASTAAPCLAQEAESDVHLVPDVVSHFTELSSASRQALRARHSRGPSRRAAPLTQQPLDTSRALQQALRGREQAEWEADTSGPPAETCLQDPSPGEALATSLAPPSGCS